MSKNFKNPVPIVYNIEDVDGKPKTLSSISMTPKKFQELDSIAVNEEMNIYDRGLGQMAVIFGGKAEDYANINQLVIKAVLSDWFEQIKNPIQESQEAHKVS